MEVVNINITALLVVEIVFIGFIVGLIMVFSDYYKKKKRENIGLPKLENFSSAPMTRCKPVKRPPSQFECNDYKEVIKMDRDKIKRQAEILEEIEALEAMVKAYESESKSSWIASTKIRKCGLTSSYEINISRKESKERFLEWIKNEIKLLEELIK